MLDLNLLPGAMNELIASVSETHQLTLLDRYGLMAAILDENATEEELRCIDRLIRSFLRGKIQVTA